MNLFDALMGTLRTATNPFEQMIAARNNPLPYQQPILVKALQGLNKNAARPIAPPIAPPMVPASRYYNMPHNLPTMNLNGTFNGLGVGPSIFSGGGASTNYYDETGQLGQHNQRWGYPALQYNPNSIPQRMNPLNFQ